jgi:peptidoglycan/xylan/chitin deacetylase (PgdA/CDA1 family)
MMNSGSDPSSPGRFMPDGISCVGALFLVVLIMTALGVGLGSASIGGNGQASKNPPAKATETLPALAMVSPTALTMDLAPILAGPTPLYPPENLPTPTNSQIVASTDNFSNLPTLRRGGSALELEGELSPIPLPTPHDNYSATLKVPILMYHYISLPPENADEYRVDLSVFPDEFKTQMQFLVNNGYETIDLYDLSLAIVGEKELPPRPVIITMDDGYRDNYENAFPILQELGLSATFFIVTEFVDQGSPNYMDWRMIEEMAAAGMRIEPHSKTHADLTEHERDFIIWEVLGSTETLEAHTKYRPRYLAYPGGWYNDEVQQIVAELGFWGAVTTARGLTHGFEDRFEWSRIRIRGTTTIGEFADLIK